MNRIGIWAGRIGPQLVIGSALLLSATAARASVKLEGTWPESEKTISIDASGMARSEAVRKIADAAGWSVVVHAPAGDPIDLHVKNQPPAKVLDLVLDDASYVATRDGSLISIERQMAGATAATASAAPPVAPTPIQTATATPPVPPTPSTPAIDSASTPPTPPPAPSITIKGEDRLVTGGSVRIEKGETAKDVTVIGGSVDVFGDVTGDLTVLGGSAHVHKDAHVGRDATAIGGSLDIDDGATIDGDVGVVGGVLTRAPGAKIHGDIVQGKKVKHDIQIKMDDPSDEPATDGARGFSIHRTTRSIGSALTRSAILFVFGAMLLALATDRMERLRAEIASRPMRAFAIGFVGTLALTLAIVVLCITVIGIPIAVVGTLVMVFGGYAGCCAALATSGQALFGHRTKNPYVHLAIGCFLLMILSAIPVIGIWVDVFVALVGIGALFSTRGAGILSGRARATA